jgi:hypothetical protein
MCFVRYVAVRSHVLQLNVILIEVLDDSDIVVLHLRVILFAGHGADARCRWYLGTVEASRICLRHVVHHMVFQILSVANLVRLLASVDATAE